MWYDNKTKKVLDEADLYELLNEVGHENKYCFNIDETIDVFYPPVEYYDTVFYPSEIIKNLASNLYLTIMDEEIDFWVKNELYGLDLYELKDGDTLDQYIHLQSGKEILSTIIWREDDE